MKNLSRLTALLLAFMVAFGSVPVGVADSLPINQLNASTWSDWVKQREEEISSFEPVINEGGQVIEYPTAAQVDMPIYTSETTQELTARAAGSEQNVSVALPQYGKVTLTVENAGQWQVNVAGQWVNVAGETATSFAVTYAKMQSLFQLNGGSAEVRWVSYDGETVSDTAVIGLDYSLTTIPQEEDDLYASAANVPAVASTFALTRNAVATANETGDATADTDVVPDNFTVVINYVFENNEIVASPYTASLARGSDFNTTVTFPEIKGYLPYLDDATETSKELELEIKDIQDHVSYTVWYKPTNVNYTVIHYWQNVDDDNYTIHETETLQGLTKSKVQEVANEYPGFYALLYEKPEIAADESTVVEIYYDRNYYLMNFDLSGGYGVEPIYGRFGAEIGDVGTPTRAGYTFQGWSLDGTTIVDLPDTMPAGNRTYKAIWEADPTAKVTIVFWGENADDEEYSHIKSSEVQIKPGTSFTYSEDGSLICGFAETHTHDASCGYACNKTEHMHTIQDGCYELTCTTLSHNHINEGCTLNCTHTHALDCYSTSGNLVQITQPDEELTQQNNDIYIYTTRFLFWNTTHYVLKIGDNWYESSQGDENAIYLDCNHSHGDSCYTCGKAQSDHTHTVENGCYNLTCTTEAHTHSDACSYNCGKTAHEHTSSCYMSGVGMDSNLWTFVRSETVTVKADGSSVVNVYYDRTQKTLTFKYNYRNYSYNTTKTITAKWGEDIADEYVAIADDAGSTFWSATSDGEGPYTNYFGVMPIASATYYHRDASGSSGTMRYYGEDLNGVYQEMFSVNDVGGYTVTVEDRYEFEGFTYHHGTSTGSSCSGAAFYYTRNSYNLIFNDGYNDVRTESVKFEAPLSTYEDYVPIVPSAYEPGSVEFGGWYLNPECTGEEYKLAEHTMPADNVLLYAKWVPVTHTVEFYLDRAAYDAGTKLSTHPDVTVSHGSMVTPEPADPTNGDYTFVEWFYLDENGEEKAIDFANMTVNQDLKVYAKWSSNVLVEYSVYFKTKDENGEEIEIADPITGSSLAGNSKTFDAKGEGELYADYQSGYFPLVKSHTLTLSIDDPTKNTFTFWYEPAIEVPYIVKYLDAETGDSLYDDKVVSDNAKAVVTETFVTISGYMPDAYQKRLVVTGDKNIADNTWIEVTMDDGETVKVHPENVIIFEYTEDEEHSYYKITHYTQNTDGENWTEYKSSEAVGDIGIYYTGSPLTIPGFTYNRIEYKVEGKVVSEDKITDEGVALTPDGLEINLYYNRNEYPYQVRYLEQGTGRELHTPKDGTGLYGQVISETAIDNIENYTAVDPTSQTLNIHIEESNEAKLNIITFYYVENDVTINYVAVGPTGAADFGSVSPTSETIKVLTGEAKGSTATATSNVYRFVGWYKDEACTNQISTDAKYVPAKVDDKNVAATYYAKFEYNLTSLTIQKTGVDEEFDPGASFVFNIFGEGVDLDVVIYGNGTTEIYGLTVGETYTVTETAGSWRYTPDATSKTIKLNAAGNKVTFVNERTGTQWLDSNCSEENVFTAPTGTTN